MRLDKILYVQSRQLFFETNKLVEEKTKANELKIKCWVKTKYFFCGSCTQGHCLLFSKLYRVVHPL